MEHANGVGNGSAKPANGVNSLASSMNGHASKPRRKPTPKQSSGLFAWAFSVAARLFTWYSIITVLFRCPATLDQCTDESPRICKSYFQLKHTVAPHLEPYYDTYAAPYVELARPYYETVDQKVLTPGWAYATRYGGPRVAQAQEYGQAQWEKTLQPELTKYQVLAKAKYDETLAPHVEKVSSAFAPYYDIARTNVLQTYHEFLLPSYVFVQPYAQQGYATASTFTTETAIPSVAWAWNNTLVFLDNTVWPQLRFLYKQNVEPQLVKIGQRIGRHNASNTQKVAETMSSTAAKAASTVTKPTSVVQPASSAPASSSADTSSTEPSSADTVASSSEHIPVKSDSMEEKIKENEVTAPDAASGESDTRRIARETVAQDLKDWQEKYAQAADEGAIEIDERVDEISKRMISRQVNTMGKSLVETLQKAIDAELTTLKADIKSTIGQVKAGSETPESAEEQITAAVRRAGLEIKEKSQDVRDWSDNYERELQATVLKAAENHFNILNNIRDLALQKIGMKWAWMDGVTYKDWKKYHLLKDRFNEWETDLKDLITNHPGLQDAEDAGRAVESQAMDLAQTAVKELGSLKQISGWKLATHDDSDEFDPDVTRSAAEAASKAAAEEAQSSQTETEAGGVADESSSAATESLSSDAEEASSSVAPGQDPEEAHDTPDLASTVILEETPVFVGNTTEATEPAKADELEKADLPVDEASDPLEADIPSANELSSEPTASVKSAFMGAAAQSVPSRQPILDDDDSSNFEAVGSVIVAMQSDVPATISSAASSAYAAAISGAAERYSQALSLVSAQISGTPKPVHEQYLASVTSAYGNAVAKASSGLDAALSAATGGFAATTSNAMPSLPTFAGWSNVESIAASRLSENQAWVASQYESAKVAIGLATATPTDLSGTASSAASVAGESLAAVTAAAGENVQKLLSNAQYNYYAGLGVAQERYSQFLAAAGSALSSVTATPTPTDLAGTLSSVASVASESAGSAASVVGENASSVAAAGYDNVASAADAAGTFASESWNAIVEQISAQVYGQPEPTAWYENFYNAMGDYAASATEAVVGSAETVTSAAGSYASEASEEASKQYIAVSSIISELLVGKEPTLSESVYSRLAGAYAAAASTAGSFANAASSTVASVATEATEAVKEAVPHVKDEL
ncbi:hypothetical protein N0V82_008210 [Gnomoniopsis sp. IMI 355080]|nr:hypothetical protein N0V82_008210 [Gnomoniopsis sp. IMI 355080]